MAQAAILQQRHFVSVECDQQQYQAIVERLETPKLFVDNSFGKPEPERVSDQEDDEGEAL